MASKAHIFYRFEVWAFVASVVLIALAGLLTFFSYTASSAIIVLAVLLYILARGLAILMRGVKYESKARLLLLFALLLGLVFLMMGVKTLFALMLIMAIDFLLLFNRYRKTR